MIQKVLIWSVMAAASAVIIVVTGNKTMMEVLTLIVSTYGGWIMFDWLDGPKGE
jgi:hypothetical protein